MKTVQEKKPKKGGKTFQIGTQLVQANQVKKIIEALDNMNNSLIEQLNDETEQNKIQELLVIQNDVQDAKKAAINRETLSEAIKMLNDPQVKPEIVISVSTTKKVLLHATKDAPTTANVLRHLLRQADKNLNELFNKIKNVV
ncbi:hypothetical protein [Ekhidna sp.]